MGIKENVELLFWLECFYINKGHKMVTGAGQEEEDSWGGVWLQKGLNSRSILAMVIGKTWNMDGSGLTDAYLWSSVETQTRKSDRTAGTRVS